MPPTLLRPALAFAFFLVGFASLHADTYTVTSNSDTDAAGTLRWAIGQANADADSNIALANNLGVITLGSELAAITSAVTINGGTGNSVSGDLSLEGSMVNFASTGTTTYSGVISGSGGLLISGSGDIFSQAETHLTGTNTFTGNVTVNGGKLGLTSGGSLGNGTALTINNGGLRILNTMTIERPISGTGEMLFQSHTADLTIKGGLVHDGLLTTVSGDGNVIFDGGASSVANMVNYAALGSTKIINGASLTFTSGDSFSLNNGITVSGVGSALNARNIGAGTNGWGYGIITVRDGATLNARLIGLHQSRVAGTTEQAHGELLVESGGKVVLSDNLIVGHRAAEDVGRDLETGVVNVIPTAIVRGQGTSMSLSVLTIGGRSRGIMTIEDGADVTASGYVQLRGPSTPYRRFPGQLTIGGTEGSRGRLTTTALLFGNPTEEDTVTLNGGILRASAHQAAFVTLNSGNSGAGIAHLVLGDQGGFLDSNGFDIGIGTVVRIRGTGALIKLGEGTLTLSGNQNSYSGGTDILGGTLAVGHANALGSGGIRVGRGGTLSILSGVTLANPISLSEGGTMQKAVAAGAALSAAVHIDAASEEGITTFSAAIIAGTSSTTTNISTSIGGTSLATNDAIRSTEVLHLSGVSVIDPGTGETDMFVLQLSVPFLTTDSLLGWLDPETNMWVNAVDGNFGDSISLFVEGAYDPNLNFHLGTYGRDMANGSVWAVINHNSDFSVTSAVPEPSTYGLIIGGVVVLYLMRRRKVSA